MTATTTRRRLSPEQRRTELLDHAAEVVVSEGFGRLTMEGLARAAGVSAGLPYSHFANVRELAVALLEREAAHHYQRIKTAGQAYQAFGDKMRASISAYFDAVLDRGHLLNVLRRGLAAEGSPGPFTQEPDKFLSWLGSLIAGEYGLSHDRAMHAAALIAALGDQAGTALLQGAEREKLEEDTIAFILGGLEQVGRT